MGKKRVRERGRKREREKEAGKREKKRSRKKERKKAFILGAQSESSGIRDGGKGSEVFDEGKKADF